MKLQHLAIIFLIIILPIVLVLSVYVDYHIDAINLKHTYDTKLLDATYDSLKSYQLNTINNAISDISASKIEELEAAVKTFHNSLTTTYGYTGYKSSVMQDYVPAVVFAMYDGYYIYSPYRNVLTGVARDDASGDPFVDEKYEDNTMLQGLKSYVFYSCRYKIDNDNDFVITYSLDNYITIQGTVDGEYVQEHGYLIDGITEDTSSPVTDDVNHDGVNEEYFDYIYDGVRFEYDNKREELKEFLGDKEYSYIKINGTKYYLAEDGKSVFYLNKSGERTLQTSEAINPDVLADYKKLIQGNNSAYKYYRESYNFTKWVRDKIGNLNSTHAIDESGNPITDFMPSEFLLDRSASGEHIHYSDSQFNAHRSEVIRYTITKNLSAAIAGYNNYFKNAESSFVMPKISETDWEIVENNISIITFLQGFKIGGRDYNEYCVVANNLNKEYVNEKDIYIIGKDKTYSKVQDKTLNVNSFDNEKWLTGSGSGKNYAPGVWKLNFEERLFVEENSSLDYIAKEFFPISYTSGSTTIPYIGTYASVISSTSVDTTESDMYKYMRNKSIADPFEKKLKETYYTALARERYGQYSGNNDIDLLQGIILNPTTPGTLDTTLPNVTIDPSIITDNDNWTNQDIILTGRASDNHIIDFNFDPDGDQKTIVTQNQDVVEATLKVSDSGAREYRFFASDSANTESAFTWVYIDKVNPDIGNLSPDTTDWTNDNVVVSGVIKDEHSGIINYTINDSYVTPTVYDETISSSDEVDFDLEVRVNGTYYVHAKDKAGNTGKSDPIVIGNIDKQAPIVDVTPSSANLCHNKEINIIIEDDLSGVRLNNDGKLEGEIRLVKTTNTTESGNQVEVEEYYEYTAEKVDSVGKKLKAKLKIGEDLTGIYKLYIGGDIYDNADNETSEQLIGEYIFDNEAPIVELEGDIGDDNNGPRRDSNITIKLSDAPAGVKNEANRYCYLSTSPDHNTKTHSFRYESGNPVTISSTTLNGKYYVWVDSVSDNLGNATGELYVGELTFDNSAPTVKIEPDRSNMCKNLDVTITVTDNEDGSGLPTNAQGKFEGTYYLSTSNSNNTATKTGTYISGERFNIGNDLNGTYYVWVSTITDNVGNQLPEHCIGGPYKFDNTAPTVTVNPTSSQVYTNSNRITVILQDNPGGSGIKNEPHYVYLSESSTTITQGAKRYEYTSGQAITIGAGLTDKYYLWVGDVSDKVGNIKEKHYIGEFIFDNTAPTVTVNPTSAQICKSTRITVTLQDNPGGSGVKNEPHYVYLSESNNSITSQAVRYEYTSGQAITIGEGLTNKYYLWVGDVSDNAGNIKEKHYIGEFIFDNTAPTVTVNPTSAQACKSTRITVTLQDNPGGSGVKDEPHYIYLSDSNTTITSGAKEYEYTSGQAITIGEGLTKKYYLWVGDVSDNLGNVNSKHYIGEFVFDNTAPTISKFEVLDTTETTISVKVTAADVGDAGIKDYKYYIIKPNNTSPILANPTGSGSATYTYEQMSLTVGPTYKVYVVVTDKLGNSSTSNILEAVCQNTTYRIIYNFAPNPGEELYIGSVKNENKITYTSFTQTCRIRENVNIYSEEIIRWDPISGQMWAINYWVDTEGTEYHLNTQYYSPRSKNLTLQAVWQKKSIRLTNEQVNVNLYWDRQSKDIDTHLYGYNDVNTEQDLYKDGSVYYCSNANYHIFYRNKTLGTAINLDRDDTNGGRGENILIRLNELNTNYTNIQKMIINGQSFSQVDFNTIRGLKVTITNKTNSIQLFSFDLTQTNKQVLKVGTLTKDRRRMDICWWRIKMED